MLQLRSILKICAVVAAVGILYVSLTAWEAWRVGRSNNTEQVDAIVVMGAAQYDGKPSPLLRARLDHAGELWMNKVAPIIVVTGGNQPGDRFTEASASHAYLVKLGVPSASILEEDQSRSTYEAFRNLRTLVDNSEFFASVHQIVVVTDPYHSLRSRLTANELRFDAATSSTRNSPISGRLALQKHMKEALGIAVARVIGFQNLWRITG